MKKNFLPTVIVLVIMMVLTDQGFCASSMEPLADLEFRTGWSPLLIVDSHSATEFKKIEGFRKDSLEFPYLLHLISLRKMSDQWGGEVVTVEISRCSPGASRPRDWPHREDSTSWRESFLAMDFQEFVADLFNVRGELISLGASGLTDFVHSEQTREKITSLLMAWCENSSSRGAQLGKGDGNPTSLITGALEPLKSGGHLVGHEDVAVLHCLDLPSCLSSLLPGREFNQNEFLSLAEFDHTCWEPIFCRAHHQDCKIDERRFIASLMIAYLRGSKIIPQAQVSQLTEALCSLMIKHRMRAGDLKIGKN